MKHRHISLSSRLRSPHPLQQDRCVPVPQEQDTGLVWKQENGGCGYPSPFALTHRDCRKPLCKEIKGGKKSRKGLDWAEPHGREAVEPGLGTGKCLATRDGVCAPTHCPAKARSLLEHVVKATCSPEGIPTARTGRSERSAFLRLGMHCPELLRGKQEAELALARCFSPALPQQIPQHLEQDSLPGVGQSTQANVTSPSGKAPWKGLEGTSEAGHRAPCAALSSQRADEPSAVDLWTLA